MFRTKCFVFRTPKKINTILPQKTEGILCLPRCQKHCKYHVSQSWWIHKIATTTRSVPDAAGCWFDGWSFQAVNWMSFNGSCQQFHVCWLCIVIYIYPPINWHRPCQIGVGRLVSTKKLLFFRVQLLISQRVRVYVIPYPSPTIWLASSPASFACFSASKATCSTCSACKCRTFEPFQCV